MTKSDAYKLLEDFVITELNGIRKGSWYLIDGGRICDTCAVKKARKLYILITEDSIPILKCFRASCGMVNAKPMTALILRKFGFTNPDATGLILSSRNRAGTIVTKKTLGSKRLLIGSDPLSPLQSEYLNDRCKVKAFSDNVVSKYNLITNIDAFKKRNDIDRDLRITDNNAITFLTEDGVMTSRYIHDSNNGFNHKINKLDEDVTSTIGYVINRNENPSTLVVSEGIFDLINLERYFINMDDALYVASLGFAKMVKVIKHHLEVNQHISRIIILMDSDIKLSDTEYTYDPKVLYEMMEKIASSRCFTNIRNNIWILNNTQGKDIGDLRNGYFIKKAQFKF